jgi:hypothetical protein
MDAAVVEFGDCYQQFITEMLQFQQKQAQVPPKTVITVTHRFLFKAQLKFTKFKINCNHEWEVEKWLRRPVQPFFWPAESSQVRHRLVTEDRDNVSFFSREQEFESVCAEFRKLLKSAILPLAERKLELESLLLRLESSK